jgi:predicted small secreted protein
MNAIHGSNQQGQPQNGWNNGKIVLLAIAVAAASTVLTSCSEDSGWGINAAGMPVQYYDTCNSNILLQGPKTQGSRPNDSARSVQ